MQLTFSNHAFTFREFGGMIEINWCIHSCHQHSNGNNDEEKPRYTKLLHISSRRNSKSKQSDITKHPPPPPPSNQKQNSNLKNKDSGGDRTCRQTSP